MQYLILLLLLSSCNIWNKNATQTYFVEEDKTEEESEITESDNIEEEDDIIIKENKDKVQEDIIDERSTEPILEEKDIEITDIVKPVRNSKIWNLPADNASITKELYNMSVIHIEGGKVYPVRNGRVIYVGNDINCPSSHGKKFYSIIISHKVDGVQWLTSYGKLKKILAKKGQLVDINTDIAETHDDNLITMSVFKKFNNDQQKKLVRLKTLIKD